MRETIVRSLKTGVSVNESGDKHVLYGFIPYNSRSENLGGFVEYIEPTAFNKTIADGADVKALVGHDERQLLGRVKNGSLRLLSREDGLHVECDVPDITYGRDAYEQVRSGLNPGLSFGFSIIEQDVGYEDGKEVHRLREVRLFEVSFCVTFPAYPETNSYARSIRGIDIAKLQETLSKDKLDDSDIAHIKEVQGQLDSLLPKEQVEQPIIQTEKQEPDGPVAEPENTSAVRDTEAVKEEQQALKQIFDDLKKLYKEI